MAEVVVYHHVQGLTGGMLALADDLRRAGHVVHTPDMFDGRTFGSIEEGMAFAREAGFDALTQRGLAAAEAIGPHVVHVGFSFGVMAAQRLAQTSPGARGAVLVSAALPASEFGGTWPAGVPLQVHLMEGDEFAEEDLPAARALVEEAEEAELFLYPGEGHLFPDSSLPDYDEAATTLFTERVHAFLDGIG